MKIDTKPIPVETTNSIYFVERYHTPLRRAYKTIKAEIPNASRGEVLQYAVKSINDSVGPDGLFPTLLVYGSMPRLRLPSDKPSAGTYEMSVAVRKAYEQMSRFFAQRLLKETLRPRNGSNVIDIHKTPLGSEMTVYHTNNNSWDRPFTLRNTNGEICTVQCTDGPKQSRSTVVKPYREGNPAPEDGMRIEVYWPKYKAYYKGTISSFHQTTGQHEVRYDDGDIENIKLNKEQWRIEDLEERQPTAFITFNGVGIYEDSSTPEEIENFEFINKIEALIKEIEAVVGNSSKKVTGKRS